MRQKCIEEQRSELKEKESETEYQEWNPEKKMKLIIIFFI